MIEIERKFLVKSDAFKKEALSKTRIVQGFLNTDPERTVRVRIREDAGFLTIKGKSNDSGTSRFEWEEKINLHDAEALLDICEEAVIDKMRYEILIGKHTFEVDEFQRENQGLLVAEVELNTEDEAFEKPEWLGEEVTGQVKYYNSQLSKRPYKNW